MKTCDDCSDPAQWVMLWVKRVKETEEQKKARETKKLIPIGPEFIVGGRFCATHKLAIEKIPCDQERVFRFAGAVVA